MLLIPVNSDLLLEPALFESSTALWACLKITIDLSGIKPTPGFRFKFASPDRNTGVPQKNQGIVDDNYNIKQLIHTNGID